MPIKVYTSHYIGDFVACPSFSRQDKERLMKKFNIKPGTKTLSYDDDFEEDIEEKEYAKMFGYDENFDDGDTRESTSRKIPDIIPETHD